ncbi:MAG TPA: hypothetical protein VHU23_11945 [Rhizomicrobium sp.]|jgi:hypothetical protein|nr:hypothetical protein [Rhizomicrobium sp.]
MGGPWNPLAESPPDQSNEESTRWLQGQIAAFQRAHPDMPEGHYYSLRKGDQSKLVRAFDKARSAARNAEASKNNPKLARALKRRESKRPTSSPHRSRGT